MENKNIYLIEFTYEEAITESSFLAYKPLTGYKPEIKILVGYIDVSDNENIDDIVNKQFQYPEVYGNQTLGISERSICKFIYTKIDNVKKILLKENYLNRLKREEKEMTK